MYRQLIQPIDRKTICKLFNTFLTINYLMLCIEPKHNYKDICV
jgi:hypothetical protein